jgi:hypothetical protein
MASKKDEEILRYDRMVERALRGVVREAVKEVIKDGLSGDHHFYITFLTDYDGVKIPDYLRERYPGEMTIVLQYQFYDLEVDDAHMGVTLSFNNVPERLEIPLPSITIFADPSVNFALQFQPLEGTESGGGGDKPKGKKSKADKGDKEKDAPAAAKTGEVVSLDQFRKK